MNNVKIRNIMRYVVRILATTGVLLQQVALGDPGAGAGAVMALTILAIWHFRKDATAND